MRLIGFLDKFLIKTSDRTFPVDHLPRRRANALNIQTSTLKKFSGGQIIFSCLASLKHKGC